MTSIEHEKVKGSPERVDASRKVEKFAFPPFDINRVSTEEGFKGAGRTMKN